MSIGGEGWVVGLGGVPLSVLGEVGAAEGSKQRGRSSIRHLGEATPGTELGGLTPLGVPESGDARGFVEMADLQGFGVQIGGECRKAPGRRPSGWWAEEWPECMFQHRCLAPGPAPLDGAKNSHFQ